MNRRYKRSKDYSSINVSRFSTGYFGLIVIFLVLGGCSSGSMKPQIEANVESEVIEIPVQAAIDFKVAIAHLNQDRLDKAELILKKMISHYPQLAGPYANLGVVFTRQKKWNEAKKVLLEGELKNPKNIKILNQLGYVYRNSGDFKKAEKTYLKAIKKAPGETAAYINVGILYDIYMGDFNQASRYYQKYQTMLSKPDRKVAGWIVDINRRAGIKTQIASDGSGS
ncbi:MAG: tetratricopeptide repeat protein [Bermanella sp.]